MINGESSEYSKRYVTHQEFSPIVEKVDSLLIKQAIMDEKLGKLPEFSADIKDIKSIVQELVTQSGIRAWVIKALVCIFGGVLGVATTLITAHFTGLFKIFGKWLVS